MHTAKKSIPSFVVAASTQASKQARAARMKIFIILQETDGQKASLLWPRKFRLGLLAFKPCSHGQRPVAEGNFNVFALVHSHYTEWTQTIKYDDTHSSSESSLSCRQLMLHVFSQFRLNCSILKPFIHQFVIRFVRNLFPAFRFSKYPQQVHDSMPRVMVFPQESQLSIDTSPPQHILEGAAKSGGAMVPAGATVCVGRSSRLTTGRSNNSRGQRNLTTKDRMQGRAVSFSSSDKIKNKAGGHAAYSGGSVPPAWTTSSRTRKAIMFAKGDFCVPKPSTLLITSLKNVILPVCASALDLKYIFIFQHYSLHFSRETAFFSAFPSLAIQEHPQRRLRPQ
jgi:hypothetical protein